MNKLTVNTISKTLDDLDKHYSTMIENVNEREKSRLCFMVYMEIEGIEKVIFQLQMLAIENGKKSIVKNFQELNDKSHSLWKKWFNLCYA
jgi:hypothetical protein